MSDEPREPMPPPALPPVTRRSFLFKLGLGLNALAAALVSVSDWVRYTSNTGVSRRKHGIPDNP